ncbi:2357_t:CDS:2 [Cetraspora pellucida]|uniref:2357_t:CDS:1 n=1 Tax=Cetraspora pellucida TaxID=1433469 RepID=A0ACA9KUA6_9GLOM|nr:2357_t:CDS:2 [Cetraspora pellucida]
MTKITNLDIYTAIQSLEDLIKSQYIEQQKWLDDQDQLLNNLKEEVKLQFADQQNKIKELMTIVQQKGLDSSDDDNNRQLVNIINAELVSLNDHNGLISNKLNTFETLLRSHNSSIQDKNNFSSSLHYPKAIKHIRKRVYNEQKIIDDTRHSYHETHPTLVHYLHRKIKLHLKKKIAYDNKTLPANQTIGKEYLPDVSNTPTAGNNPIIIERYVDYFMKDWKVRKNTNELVSEQLWIYEVITDIAVQYFQHLHKNYLALQKNSEAFNNQNIKQRCDNRLSLKSKALLKALDQYSDTEDLRHPKEEIKLILHKRCMSPELTDEEYQELHPQDKKQLIVAPIYWHSNEHNRLRTILNSKAGIQCPSRWSPYSKGKERDNGMLKHVHPDSDHSQYEELTGLSPDKLSFLPD